MEFELKVIKFFQNSQNAFYDLFFWFFSIFAGVLGIVLVFVLFLVFVNKKYAICFLIISCVNLASNYILKCIIARPRPYVVDSKIINKVQTVGHSFPSGHMVIATTIVFFITLLIFRKYNSKKVKLITTICNLLFLLTVAISRMYFGQHYITDIFAGVSIGYIFSSIQYLFFNKYIYTVY